MMGLILLAVTSAESQDEPSKTAFYIAGGLLVALALGVSALGVRSETFPRSRGAQLVVIGLSAVLVAASMLTAVVTA
jgi:uncharacterized membrane protein